MHGGGNNCRVARAGSVPLPNVAGGERLVSQGQAEFLHSRFVHDSSNYETPFKCYLFVLQVVDVKVKLKSWLKFSEPSALLSSDPAEFHPANFAFLVSLMFCSVL